MSDTSVSFLIFVYAKALSLWLFFNVDYYLIFRILSVVVPFIAMNRIFNGIISGISAYKVHAKIELIWYTLASFLLLLSLYFYNIEGVLVAIAITPTIQFLVLTNSSYYVEKTCFDSCYSSNCSLN